MDNGVMSKDNIMSLMKTDRFSVTVEREVTSTNTLLRQMAEKGAPDGTVLIAECQTAGRGRMGRSFYSPADNGLYMSLLIRRPMNADDAVNMTTRTAVAVCRALDRFVSGAKIKWVNDIYLNDKKVCGILTEGMFDSKSGLMESIIIGIGINLVCPAHGYPDEIKNVAGAVFDELLPDIHDRVAAAVLDEVDAAVFNCDIGEICRLYRLRSWLDGKSINVIRGNETFSATAVGIDDAMRLTVKKDDGEILSLLSGEVSVKLSYLVDKV